MKFITAASAVALIALSISAAKANKDAHNVEAFGPVYEMPMGTKVVHVQAIEDQTGGQWIVISREDAELVSGNDMSKYVFKKLN